MATKAQTALRRLIKAIHQRDVDEARALLDAGADPNLVGAYDATPLGIASSIDDDPAARAALTALLLERGADPNFHGPYEHDNRPIFYATYCGYEPVVRLLLEAGGFPRDPAGAPARNGDGSTLLALACASGMRWLAERALAEGCRADEVDNHGSTALHYAAVTHDVVGRVDKDSAGLIDLLIAAGAPIEHQRPGDWGTATHWAVSLGDAAAVRALAAHGARLDARTERNNRTPLHEGGRSGAEDAIAAALELGADVHATDAQGKTPLHFVAGRLANPKWASAAVQELLLAAGADPDARDADGKVPLEIAAAALPMKGRRRLPLEPAQADQLAALAARSSPAIAARLKLPT